LFSLTIFGSLSQSCSLQSFLDLSPAISEYLFSHLRISLQPPQNLLFGHLLHSCQRFFSWLDMSIYGVRTKLLSHDANSTIFDYRRVQASTKQQISGESLTTMTSNLSLMVSSGPSLHLSTSEPILPIKLFFLSISSLSILMVMTIMMIRGGCRIFIRGNYRIVIVYQIQIH
jgi:hypothetical protein